MPFNLNRRAVVWIAGLIVAVNGFFPALWILLTSLKTETELIQTPITYLPQAPTLDNYATAFTAQPILRFMWNSFVVASLSTALCVFVSALAAYALTRLRMPRRNLIFTASGVVPSSSATSFRLCPTSFTATITSHASGDSSASTSRLSARWFRSSSRLSKALGD